MKIFTIILWLLILPFYALAQEGYKFDSLIFHTYNCITGCPSYQLKISKTKVVNLYVVKVFSKNKKSELFIDSSKHGYFEGKINKRSFRRLINYMQLLKCQNEENKNTFYFDAEPHTLIIFQGSKRCYFKSMYPDSDLQKVFIELLKICKNGNLSRVKNI